MKTILLSITFIAISTLCTAQFAMNIADMRGNVPTATKVSTNVKKKAPVKRTLKMIQNHNQSALNQLTTFLNQELAYSSIMENNYMEGKVVIEVNLSRNGKLVDIKVIESLNPVVDKVVIETMSKLKSVQFENNIYQGNKRIQIPIGFSMK